MDGLDFCRHVFTFVQRNNASFSPLFCYRLPATFLSVTLLFLALSLFGSWEKTDWLCWDFWSQRPAGTLELLTGDCQAEWLTYWLPDQLSLPLLLRWNRGRWWREEESSRGLWVGCHAQIYMCQFSEILFYPCHHKSNVRNEICSSDGLRWLRFIWSHFLVSFLKQFLCPVWWEFERWCQTVVRHTQDAAERCQGGWLP